MMRTHINIADLTTSVDSLIDAIDVLIRKADDDLEEELKAEGYVEAKKAVEIIGELEDGWTEAYNNHCDDLLGQLEKALDLDDFVEKKWPKIESNEDLRDAIYEVFHDRFFNMLETSVSGWLRDADSELFADLLDDGAKILSEPAKAFVEDWTVELSSLMHLNTNEQIGKILINGQEKHLSVAQVAQNISDSGIRDPGYKARRAAVTEVLRAESYGQLEAMRQNPAIIEKEWQHTGSHKNKPRENHVAMSGQRVPVDQPFSLKGADGGSYSPMCPRDSNLPAGESINCHCMMRQIRDPKWNDLTFEEKQAARDQRMAELNGEYSENEDVETYLRNNIPKGYKDTRIVGEQITQERLDNVVSSAKEKGIRLGANDNSIGNFDLYCGDPDILDDIIDRIDNLTTRAKAAGLLKKDDSIILIYDNVLGYKGDHSAIDVGAFAETKGKTIVLNKFMYDDSAHLKKEYEDAVNKELFTKGTDYRNVIDHEFGHIIDKKNPKLRGNVLKILQEDANNANLSMEDFIKNNISIYAISRDSDGNYYELLAELYAKSNGTDNEYALEVLKKAGVLK